MTPLCTRICPYPLFEATPPGAAPGPPVKTEARVRRLRGCKHQPRMPLWPVREQGPLNSSLPRAFCAALLHPASSRVPPVCSVCTPPPPLARGAVFPSLHEVLPPVCPGAQALLPGRLLAGLGRRRLGRRRLRGRGLGSSLRGLGGLGGALFACGTRHSSSRRSSRMHVVSQIRCGRGERESNRRAQEVQAKDP